MALADIQINRTVISDNLAVSDKDGYIEQIKEGFSVYRGKFEEHKTVAVKKLQIDYSKKNEDGSIKKDESIFLLELAGHPNILKYYCTCVQPDIMYIVTELCSGTLEDLVDDGYNGPQVGDEREILIQITRAVAYLHERGIVHRDIKPGNILFTEEYGSNVRPRMKLADFGISCRIIADNGANDETSFVNDTSNPRGTMGWMAPEFYTSNTCGVKGDTFALGLVFGYTLSIEWRHPFDNVKIGDPFEDRCYNSQETRQYNINNTNMTLTNNDLKINYREGCIAFKLIESMVEWSPGNRPILNDILKNNAFFNKECVTV